MNDTIASIGVVGSGTMGAGIAMAFANAGIAVTLVDVSPEALARGAATIAATYTAAISRGKLTSDEANARLARIERTTDMQCLARVDLAIEAVFESLEVKRGVFARFAAICRPDAILATNTSTLDIDAIARAASYPERSLGMHFFSPAHIMKLVEIVRGEASSERTIDRTRAVCEAIGKRPIVVGNCDGFVGNRMLLGFRREAEMLVLAGATPAHVDAALEAFGFAMGPFAVSDLAGIDIGVHAKRERIARGAAPPFSVTALSDAFVAAGRLGQKSGAGYYRYEPGDRTRHPDDAAAAIVAAERAKLRIVPRSVDDGEIVERCVYALVMEGGRILDEHIARSSADIDAIWTDGYGFPRARGGPMAYAEAVGRETVAHAVARLRADDPAFWRDSTFLHPDA